MTCTGFNIKTEALITSAQEQALSTEQHIAEVLKKSIDPMCRMCKTASETISQISHVHFSCPKLAGSEYLKRHNSVATVIHRKVCQDYNIETPVQDWLHIPETATENGEVNIPWDFEIRSDGVIKARRSTNTRT